MTAPEARPWSQLPEPHQELARLAYLSGDQPTLADVARAFAVTHVSLRKAAAEEQWTSLREMVWGDVLSQARHRVHATISTALAFHLHSVHSLMNVLNAKVAQSVQDPNNGASLEEALRVSKAVREEFKELMVLADKLPTSSEQVRGAVDVEFGPTFGPATGGPTPISGGQATRFLAGLLSVTAETWSAEQQAPEIQA